MGEKHKQAPRGATHWNKKEIAIANNKYIEEYEEIDIKKNDMNIIEKYKIQIDNEFVVKYNYNLSF